MRSRTSANWLLVLLLPLVSRFRLPSLLLLARRGLTALRLKAPLLRLGLEDEAADLAAWAGNGEPELLSAEPGRLLGPAGLCAAGASGGVAAAELEDEARMGAGCWMLE